MLHQYAHSQRCGPNLTLLILSSTVKSDMRCLTLKIRSARLDIHLLPVLFEQAFLKILGLRLHNQHVGFKFQLEFTLTKMYPPLPLLLYDARPPTVIKITANVNL